ARASGAVAKAAQKASPIVLNTTPLLAVMAVRRRALCRARAERMACGNCSQSLVLPSMSVKRKVTVPFGKFIAHPALASATSPLSVGQWPCCLLHRDAKDAKEDC